MARLVLSGEELRYSPAIYREARLSGEEKEMGETWQKTEETDTHDIN